MAQCPLCGAPVATAENQVCDNCRQNSYTAYVDPQGRQVVSSEAPPAVERRKLTGVPVTRMLIAANVAVFLLLLATGMPFVGPDAQHWSPLLEWGADFSPYVLTGQYWRMFTAMFLHFGILHLLLNMWSLWQLGALTERLFGSNAYLWVYMLSGIAGNILSVAVHPMGLSVGASGAISGIAGALIAGLMFVRLDAPKDVVRHMRNNLIYVVAANLILGYSIKIIDNSAHIGGLIAGFATAFLLSKSMNISPESYRRARSWVFPFVTTVLLVAFIGVRYWRLPSVRHLPELQETHQNQP